MSSTDVVTLSGRDMADLARVARRLPADLRREFRLSVNREVVAPVAREVQAVAGRNANSVVRAFRSKGVAVKPGEEPALVVGGPERYGRTTMRSMAFGAEFGGSGAATRYSRRGRKRGRKHSVERHTTTEFGRHTGNVGRFVNPTIQRMVPQISEAYLRIVERLIERAVR